MATLSLAPPANLNLGNLKGISLKANLKGSAFKNHVPSAFMYKRIGYNSQAPLNQNVQLWLVPQSQITSPSVNKNSTEKENAEAEAANAPEAPTVKVMRVELPGYSAEDVSIEISEDLILSVTANPPEGKSDAFGPVRGYQSQFRIPENVDVDSINAEMKNGLLTLTFSSKVPKSIKIQVKNSEKQNSA